ncbi:cation-binding protein [Acuticoccus sediminis]|uniref:Cation-binding protein n=2 Tax=Acuticoccus sediminis TaxID=2184697 RepID=A0A8B2P2U1_9HYPH|nr:cation-binding protein [Acuticoccus sediminis]
MPLGLFDRGPIDDEVAVLRARYPREIWPTHHNLGETAQFWLQRHDMFRELGEMLRAGSVEFAEGRVEAGPFMGWLAPRLNVFLQQLHSHHHVEDEHYFPIFRAADARLGAGFDLLDADHHVIDALLHELADAGNALQLGLKGRGDVPGASAHLADRLARASTGLMRHLDDEEDIVVPLILDRSEPGLGL